MQIFTLGPWGGPSWSNAKAIWSWRLKICQNRVSGMYFRTRTTRPPDPPLGGRTRVSSSPNLGSRQNRPKRGSKRGSCVRPGNLDVDPSIFFAHFVAHPKVAYCAESRRRGSTLSTSISRFALSPAGNDWFLPRWCYHVSRR